MKLITACAALSLTLALSNHASAECVDPNNPPKYPNGPITLAKARPRAGRSLSQIQAALTLTASQYGVPVSFVRQTGTGADVVRLAGASDATANAIVNSLRASGDFLYVDRDRTSRLQVDPAPADQWNMLEPPGGVRAFAAWWSTGFRGAGQTIAILDGGTTDHPKLAPNVIDGYDFVSQVGNLEATFPGDSGDGDGRDSDGSDPGSSVVIPSGPFSECKVVKSVWHGTHVAGIAAASLATAQGEWKGTWGVAPDAKILTARVTGAGSQGSESDLIDAIVWAAGGSVPGVPQRAPASVMNLSLSLKGACSGALQDAIDFALSRNVPVVVAAGNDAGDARAVSPANCRGVITVAATNINGNKYSATNQGPNVTIAAPGEAVISTYNVGTGAPGGPSYLALSGTSMAAPHVAGAVAILRQASPTFGPSALKQVLMCTATRAVPDCPQCGKLLDVAAALTYVRNNTCSGGGDSLVCTGSCFVLTNPFPIPGTF